APTCSADRPIWLPPGSSSKPVLSATSAPASHFDAEGKVGCELFSGTEHSCKYSITLMFLTRHNRCPTVCAHTVLDEKSSFRQKQWTPMWFTTIQEGDALLAAHGGMIQGCSAPSPWVFVER